MSSNRGVSPSVSMEYPILVDSNALVMSFCNTTMNIQPALSLGKICRSRTWDPFCSASDGSCTGLVPANRASEKKPNGTRSILVKFASYASPDRVIRSCKLLKGHIVGTLMYEFCSPVGIGCPNCDSG